jgi:tRNA modification GTPase
VTDTIFALSSGSPPAAIAVIRVSGPRARGALEALAGRVPAPRRAALRRLRASNGEELDEALVLWLPGPSSATGEDSAELHCHGGRAVVAAVRDALAELPELREAESGEFTRRAFVNGRIDLAQAEALGDLLAAETELQRRVAQAGVGGALSARVGEWRDRVLALSAMVEAVLDFSDEDDVVALPVAFFSTVEDLAHELREALAAPRADRLRDGVRVVIGGPPNSGKSSLFNALIGDGAAIVSPLAGTTRDVIERPVAFSGVPFVLVDTAGLRESGSDAIEAIGIERAQTQLERADIVLWLGDEGSGPTGCVEVEARCDLAEARRKLTPSYRVSSVTSEGLRALESGLVDRARALLPKPGDSAVNGRQSALIGDALDALTQRSSDPLVIAESLRSARVAFDRLLGHSGVEEMLDTLFGRFCIGK